MNRKSIRFRGSVLYTVTLVMMMMLILMMTAITLAGAANKRAYSEYHDDQTTYTGRSVIESVISTFGAGKDNEAMGEHIFTELTNNPEAVVEVEVNGGAALPQGYGTVEKLEFQYVGEDNEAGYYINGDGHHIIKVTATVKMGNEVTTYSQYVTGINSAPPGKKDGGSGLLAAGGFNLKQSTGSCIHGPSFAGTFPINIDEIRADPTVSPKWKNPFDNKVVHFRNDGFLSGGGLYDSTVFFTTENSSMNFTHNVNGSSGMTVMGNLVLFNPMYALSDYKPSATDVTKDIPYIYVGGTLWSQAKPGIGESKGSDSRQSNPINVYAGRIVFDSNDGPMYSSIYCYNSDGGYTCDPANGIWQKSPLDFSKIPTVNENMTTSEINNALDGTSPISVFAGNGSATQLLDWATGTFGTKPIHTGSIFTKGSLKLGLPNYGILDVKGDINVEQILDMTQVMQTIDDDGSHKFIISGNINVNGQIIVLDEAALNRFFTLNASTKITCKVLTDSSGKRIENTFDGKVEFKDKAFDWPSEMEKDQILGKVDGGANKIIATHDDAFKRFYDVSGGKYKRSINFSGCGIDSKSVIYYSPSISNVQEVILGDSDKSNPKGGTVEITDDATLVGGFENVTFNIKPAAHDSIWINLYNVEFAGCKIIVDDSECREVNFYLPQGDNYSPSASPVQDAYFNILKAHGGPSTISDQNNKFTCIRTCILTANYYNTYFECGTELKKELNLKTYYDRDTDWKGKNVVGENYVPDVYICATDKKDKPVIPIVFGETNIVTGHIIALNSTLSWVDTKHRDTDSKLSYLCDGATLKDNLSTSGNISFIGSIFIADVLQLGNNFHFFYVDYSGDDKKVIVNPLGFTWDIIDGYVDY